MFTGIIVAVGRILAMNPRGGDSRITVETGQALLQDAQLGDSIAVNGVCLTAVELGPDYFAADVSNETLSRTTLGSFQRGQKVNLEPALLPTSRLGGHFVSGHIDAVGEVRSRQDDARSVRFEIRAPDNLARYIAEKGSICVDGISLTVNHVDGAVFGLNIVPHTLQETTLAGIRAGSRVNLEVDLLSRYMERLMLGDRAAQSERVTESLLARAGFISD